MILQYGDLVRAEAMAPSKYTQRELAQMQAELDRAESFILEQQEKRKRQLRSASQLHTCTPSPSVVTSVP